MEDQDLQNIGWLIFILLLGAFYSYYGYNALRKGEPIGRPELIGIILGPISIILSLIYLIKKLIELFGSQTPQ